ncbi:MAG TPA: YbaB/EbfC family nucleoid-associated protein [Firmicutes bacterium]|jgi:hypothetical protein|nr:YbaB/EbfC family nucleoid-associated protein [Bacillota bacterium]HAW70058.1 YbaB/EbfC family nucleoid-associated protein [Bacillota bacterium]HAZ22852.1 YbaB/EbfC family nucleoid-associated protein [Bacillota bacterium]HBE06993.1 YbaB/EbfC family nucleoid-associated protein [Bacillota bacterium]HBG43830.1 YbaB/EbfC family nucleoid-associated protein [Bacillota bacterium]
MMGNVQKALKKLQQVQEELGNMTVESTAGGGAVKVVFTGSQDLQSITIDPGAVDPDDVEMLQDLIVAAVNEGLKASRDLAQKEMGKVTGGLNIPGMPGGLF